MVHNVDEIILKLSKAFDLFPQRRLIHNIVDIVHQMSLQYG